MDKKKVAILLPWLKMGGTNKIALNFMKDLEKYYDVTLILSENSGELLEELPEDIHLIIDSMRTFKELFYEDVKKLRIVCLMKDLVYYLRIKLGKDNVDNYKYLVLRNKIICDTEFDCAISYHGQSPERLLNLLYRLKSKKKVAWIHGEFNNSEDHYRRMERYYGLLDSLFFVSNPTLESFAEKMKLNRDKAIVYYNPIDKNDILIRADEAYEPKFSKEFRNIVTVGRVSSEKGQDMIPEITKNLKDQGFNIRWYVIGDGDLMPNVQEKIKEYNVEEEVILLGTKTNPYPYMKNSDIYVQPSYTEGYSTTICEAGILGKAIIGTKPSGGIRDQITDGFDGMIVDATVEGLTIALLILLNDDQLRRSFENKILKKDFEGKGEIQKFNRFLGC